MKAPSWWPSMPWQASPHRRGHNSSCVDLDPPRQLRSQSQSRIPGRLATFMANAGWRRTAFVNTFLESLVAVTLAIILIYAVAEAGSLRTNLVFFKGDCGKSGRINTALHLLINMASTCIIASSNYFMQILSSPTRKEVDKAHRNSRSLEIGVPSIRNIGHISLTRGLLWTLFAISSAPIHVLFNSIVFETDFQGANFFMAMATEDFVQSGDAHMSLGASLMHSGTNYTEYDLGVEPNPDSNGVIPNNGGDVLSSFSWGKASGLYDYLDNSSPIMQSTASISRSSKNWTKLNARECRAQYGNCTPRRTYGDVVLVMNGQFQKNDSTSTTHRTTRGDPQAGFIIEDIYDLTEEGILWNKNNLTTDELREYWGRFGPIDQPNPLWFAAACSITFDSRFSHSDCEHTCQQPLGLPPLGRVGNVWWYGYMVSSDYQAELIRNTGDSWDIPLRYFNGTLGNYDADWTVVPERLDPWNTPATSGAFDLVDVEQRPLFNRDIANLHSFMEVTHCYAQPLQPSCKVALSNELLLVVAIGVLVKVILSMLTCIFVREMPLVTPGDAIASFIANPDPITDGQASLGVPGSSNSNNRRKFREWVHGPAALLWRIQKPARISIGIPWATWVRVYIPMIPGIGATIFLFYFSLSDPINPSSFIDKTNGNGISTIRDPNLEASTFISKVILANMPHLILSFYYFALNALFTRVCSEIEWNSYATSYKALRVSHLEKGQMWTYRLQIPYQYSAPLLVTFTLLHWLCSNAIFIVITEGDYSINTPGILPGISDRALVNLGYSSLAILICLSIFVAILLMPLLTLIRLKNKMAVFGNSSFAISAACHASTLSAKWPLARNDSFEMLPLEPSPQHPPHSPLGTIEHSAKPEPVLSPPSGNPHSFISNNATTSLYSKVSLVADDGKENILHRISRSHLRWGVVKMPPEWTSRFSVPWLQQAEHLAFGVASQEVGEPYIGGLYA